MKLLGPEAYRHARDFLKTRTRPLEKALFEHFFEGAPGAEVTAALLRYQNADGGFGRALEPDFRTPSSSALATGIALSILREIGALTELPMAQQAVGYLLGTYDEGKGLWRVIPPDANDYPHAPWWHDDGKSLERIFDGFQIIPRAQIVSLLYHFDAAVDDDWLEGLARQTVEAIERLEPTGDAFTYALTLADTPKLPNELREPLLGRLRSKTQKVVSRDPQEWTDYCLPPVWAAPTPDSLITDQLLEAVQMHLDYLIEGQSPQGYWEPFWSWGNSYPEVWEDEAKPEWRGHLTLKTLRALKAYGRLKPHL